MKKFILVGLTALGLVACGGEAPAPTEAPAAAPVVEAPAEEVPAEGISATATATEVPVAQ